MKLTTSVFATFSVAIALLAFSPVSDAQERTRGGGRQGGGPGGGGGPGRGGPGGGDPTMGLLRVEEVRAELEISPGQEEALTKMAEANRPERPDFGNIREMSEDDRRAFFEKMQKEQNERAKEMKGQLEEVLTPAQIDRLEEISLQVQGLRALANEDVAKELKITADQKAKLEEVQKSLADEMRTKMREMFSGGGGDREGMREKMMDMRKGMEEKVLGVLTSDQKKQFEDMKGEAFEMPESRGGFGGGGRGGMRGGDRGGNRGGADRGGNRGGGDRDGRRGRPESE